MVLDPKKHLMKANPKSVIAGFALEANSLSPESVREDFEKFCWYEGEAFTRLARQTSHLPVEVTAFFARMDEIAP